MLIPASVEDAVLDLKGLSELVTASEWQRAAIVWAFTHDGRKQKSLLSLGVKEFAAQGISGLSSQPTVTKYRKAWAKAIEDGVATDVKPGDLIDLPDVEWQSYFNPPREPKPRKKAISTKLPRWDENAWDGEKLNHSPRLVKMSEMMQEQLMGLEDGDIEDQMLSRVGNAIIDFVEDENKARGLARMMHSVIEFVSSYKTRQT